MANEYLDGYHFQEDWEIRENEAILNVKALFARLRDLHDPAKTPPSERKPRRDVLETRLNHGLWAISEARTGPMPPRARWRGYWFWTEAAWTASRRPNGLAIRRDYVLERNVLIDFLVEHGEKGEIDTERDGFVDWMRNACVVCVVLKSQHTCLGQLRAKGRKPIIRPPSHGELPPIEIIMEQHWAP